MLHIKIEKKRFFFQSRACVALNYEILIEIKKKKKSCSTFLYIFTILW